MAQKVNPSSVRLRFNRNSDCGWFSHYYYTSLLLKDLDFGRYFNSINQSYRNRSNSQLARCVLHHYAKRSVIHLFVMTAGNKQHFVKDTYHQQDTKHSYLANSAKATANYTFDTNHLLVNLIKQRAKLNKLFNSPALFAQLLNNQLDCGAVIAFNALFYASGYTNAFMTAHLQTQYKQHMLQSNMHQPFHDTHNKIIQWYQNQQRSKITNSEQELVALETTQFNSKNTEPNTNAEAVVCMNYAIMLYWFYLKTNHAFSAKRALIGSTSFASHKVPKPSSYLVDNETNVDQFADKHNSYKQTQSSNNIFNSFSKAHTLLAFELMALNQRQLQPLLPYTRHHSLNNIQSVVYKQNNTLSSLVPVKISSIYQSASLVAKEICSKIEQKKSFRQICRLIFQQTQSCKYIKGIRICCSGRLNGAEIAKTETKHYGETSLHVFSDQIDYAHAEAFTAYGTLGVKVWISYL